MKTKSKIALFIIAFIAILFLTNSILSHWIEIKITNYLGFAEKVKSNFRIKFKILSEL